MSKNKRFFNTVGAINPKDHYFLPQRLDWNQLTGFIEKKYYFVLHAPRQSGKTTAIIEFVKHLNQETEYTALYLSIESARTTVNDVPLAVQIILKQFRDKIKIFLPYEEKALKYLENIISKKDYEETGVYDFLRFWAENKNKPLVIFFDEFDVLAGDSLITMLTQFRTGYTDRPEHFPQTLCLIGIRDLRDYKIKTKQQEELGILYSPFNIKAESLILPNFSKEDIAILYEQHTKETGQVFTDEATLYVFKETQGQPWLVNALAYQACFRDVEDRTQPITKEVLEKAREALIKRCDTHIDALLDRLQEPRVRHIMDAIISGTVVEGMFKEDDVQYIRDLGLLSQKGYQIANPIYQEIIPRALTKMMQERVQQTIPAYLNPDGSLNMKKLLEAFTQFFRENSGTWLKGFEYHESAPHLLLMAFLQRVINGGGSISREYALDSLKVDLFVAWKSQRFVLELKIANHTALQKGLEQTSQYMNKSGAEGHLVIFDRDSDKSWEEKISHTQEVFQDRTIEVWRL